MPYEPRYKNLVTMFSEATSTYADRPLFGERKADGWQWQTYAQFRAAVADARAGLANLGITRGDRVAVISNNRLEWAISAYATYTSAAVYVPMYEAQHDKDWLYILQDSGAKLCFVANEAIEKRVRAMQHELPNLKHIVSFAGDSYQKFLQTGHEKPVEATHPADSDIAKIIYTSGTTGNPKGVRLTHINLAANVSAVLEVSPVKGGDRSLAFLPWAHVFGGTVELNTLMAIGGSIAICDNTDKLLGYLPEVKPTMLFAVPRIWNRIYDGVQKQVAGKPKLIQNIFHAGLRARSKQKRGEAASLGERIALPLAEKLIFHKIVDRFGGELRFAFSGAAALSPVVGQFIDNLGIQVFEGYGMTESSGCTTANSPAAYKMGSVGKPVPGVDVKLDKTAPGAQADEGEILIYGTGVMAGYHNQPDATKATMTADGGLRSGDLGRFDSEGFLFVTGRVKELYKLQNGRYVAPAPLEEKLQLSPYIAQSVVYGSDQPHNVALVVPDMVALKAWAEKNDVPTDPGALLAHQSTQALIQKEIEEHSRDFKGFETIRGFTLIGEEFSTANDMLTPTLKLKRRNVMAKYEDKLKTLYSGASAA